MSNPEKILNNYIKEYGMKILLEELIKIIEEDIKEYQVNEGFLLQLAQNLRATLKDYMKRND